MKKASEPKQITLKGVYRDTLTDAGGRCLRQWDWRSNTIVDAAWPLVAGLLKNEPDLSGLLFWAVGSGDPAWDDNPVTADVATIGLADEIRREPIVAEEIVFLDAEGAPSDTPTNCIEASAAFTWQDDQVLREFGLFGGNATAEAGSGYLINYVVHPRVDLAAGARLFRRMRFTLKPEPAASPPEQSPPHWLGNEPIRFVDGIGRAYAQTLANANIATIADLAALEPVAFGDTLPLMRVVELRAKARLALRTAGEIAPQAGLNPLNLREILVTPGNTLIADTGATASQVNRIKEQAGALQLTLDNRYIQQLTVGQLTGAA